MTLLFIVLSAFFLYPTIASSQDNTEVNTESTTLVIGYVSVSSINQNSVVITWTTNESATRRVEYGPTTSYGTITPNTAVGGTNHTVTLTGLNPGTTYNYRVKSADSGGTVVTSSNYTFTTAPSSQTSDTSSPSITNIGASSISSTGATITWTTDEPSDTQVVYGPSVSYGSQTSINSQMVTSHSVTLTGLTPNLAYHFQVKSKDSAGNLTTSANQAFSTVAGTTGPTPDTSAPTTPTNLVVTNSGASSISLSWSPSSDNVGVSGYIIQRCQGSACTSFIGTATTSVTSYTASSLASNTHYRFRVIAYDASFYNSPSSNIAESATDAPQSTNDTTKPAAPIGLVASPANASILLTWNAATDNVGVIGYKVFKNGVLVASVAGTTYTALDLITGVSYTFEVAAYDAAGNNSFLSPSATAMTAGSSDYSSPSRPLNLGVASFATGTRASLTWTHSTDAVGVAGYFIYRDNIKIATTTSNFHTVSDLYPNATYVFEVAAFDAANNLSARSAPVTYIARNSDTIAPSQPIGLTAEVTSNYQVNLTWTPSRDSVGVAGYHLYRNGLLISNPVTNSFADPYVTLPATYSVSAFDVAGNDSGQGIPVVASLNSTPGSYVPGQGGKTLITQDLSMGVQNSEVLILQQTLQRLGFYPSTAALTGYFGPSTQIAVRSFQLANPPLVVDGLVNTGVRNLINREITATNSISSVPVITTPGSAPSVFIPSGNSLLRNLGFGMNGVDVALLQHLLMKDGSYPDAIISGYFGALTQQAVKRFQAKYGIISSGDPSTTGYGAVGPRTREKMNSLLGSGSTGLPVIPPSPTPATIPAIFSVGDAVYTTSVVNVRTEPSLVATVVNRASQNSIASVLEGPRSVDGFIWWRLEYTSGFTGWSAENYLRLGNPPITAAPPAPAPPPLPPARPPIPIPIYAPSDSGNQIPLPQFPVGTRVYTSADLITHSTAASCWSVIDGVVYDLTNWIDQHPGGRTRILALCGIDGSSDFHAQHGTNAMQVNILQGFKVGPYTR